VFAFPWAVAQKFGNDQAGGKAALMAYYGLFALFYGRRRRRSAGLEGVQAEFTRADDRLAAR
jgi:hypothetical protein